MIPPRLQEDVLFFAFRYCLGRQTYAVPIAVEAIIESWPNLSSKCKYLIKKEIIEYKIEMMLDHDIYLHEPEWMKILVLED